MMLIPRDMLASFGIFADDHACILHSGRKETEKPYTMSLLEPPERHHSGARNLF